MCDMGCVICDVGYVMWDMGCGICKGRHRGLPCWMLIETFDNSIT